MTQGVHRVIEQRVAAQPEAVAILDDARGITYYQLNQRANALARRLRESGLIRGSFALVRMPRSADLAVALLAVLKAGACYSWFEPESPYDRQLPGSFCIDSGAPAKEEQWLALDLNRALRESECRSGPNLPILTRGSDVACVLPDVSGRLHLLVPHATITSLPETPAARCAGRALTAHWTSGSD